MGRRGFSQGVSLGIVLFLCYLFQTLGLERTTASNAGFLSGLGMVWVPLLSGPLVGKKPGGFALAGVGLAVAGLLLLTWRTPWELNPGDLLIIVSSFFIALHILGVDTLSECCDGRALAFVQIATMAVLCLSASLLLDPVTVPRHVGPTLLRAVLFTSLFATGYAFWVQSSFQRLTTPTRAAIIYTLEPVAAAVFAFLLGGERLGPLGAAGGGLIVLGMLAARLRPSRGSSPGF
jgi:drug/metabolite transporter (DMT)-like permease